MTAIGLDIGGSKIELQVFGPDWQMLVRDRVATPADYPALLATIAAMVRQAEADRGRAPVGISTAGLIDRQTGLARAANLPSNGRPFSADLAAALGRPVAFVNDARAMALSEAHLGAAQGAERVLGLVLGTGVGGAMLVNGRIEEGASGIAGEIGHVALPAPLVQRHALPLLPCGCGRVGCAETLMSGPGLGRLAQHLTGQALTAPELAARRDDPKLAAVWSIWCDLVAELLVGAILTCDPDVVVLGGGVSRIDGLTCDLTRALRRAHLPGLALPRLVLATGGDATGARGAAIAALQMQGAPA